MGMTFGRLLVLLFGIMGELIAVGLRCCGRVRAFPIKHSRFITRLREWNLHGVRNRTLDVGPLRPLVVACEATTEQRG
jgi:hypothetical protein